MESTSPKKLRAELKDYLDLAATEPIRIQRRLLGMSEVLDGKSTEYTGKEERLKRFKK